MEKINLEMDLLEIKDRWKSAEGVFILNKLFLEKIELDDLIAGMVSAKTPFERSDLRGIDFTHKDLSHNFLLGFLDLSHSDFSKAKIKGSFQDSIMLRCNFFEATILSGYFCGANLSNSTFESSYLKNAEFQHADLTNVSFKNAKLINVNFVKTDLTSVNFENSEFGCVTFWKTRMKNVGNLKEIILNSPHVLNADEIIWV